MLFEKKKLFRLFQYYKPYRGIFFADLFFALISAGIALIIPLVVRYITSTVIYLNSQKAMHTFLLIGILLFGLVILQLFSNYFINNYGHVMGAKIEYDMRSELFSHYQKLPFSFYDNQKVGHLMSRLTTDLFEISELLHHGPENLIISILKLSGAFIILAFINPILLVAAFLLIPFMVLYAYFFNRKMNTAFRQNRAKISDINGRIEDNLSGIRVVKSFANEKIEEEKFQIGNDGFMAAKRNSYHYMAGYYSGLNAFTSLIQVVVIFVGGIMIFNQMLNITDLLTFLLYISIFTEPIKTLIDFTEQFQNGYSGYERFVEMLEIQPDITDSKDAIDVPRLHGHIRFEDVCFRYEENAHRVLRHIHLDIPAGEYVALVGASGAGKSTLCSLIPRFYDVSDGKILIDQMNIQHMKLKSLRNNIGIVQQDVYLFSGTVYENILYGRTDATRDEVIQASIQANAHEFIMTLPNGYDTDIGQRGIKLSGGQKQRLSIARVFLKNPSILIFDEATSSLDNESERVVQESLENLAKNRTTLVIAHRLSTIKNADRILVLTENGIDEEGSHKELLTKKGVYHHLYQMAYSENFSI